MNHPARFTLPSAVGPILITHFTLLLGMAAPVWLSNALSSDNNGSSLEGGAGGQPEHQQPLWLAAHAGIMILGADGWVHGTWQAIALARLPVLSAFLAGHPVPGHSPGLRWSGRTVNLYSALPPLLAGFGDTAASAIGSLYGRRCLCPDTSKTWEGTAAAVAATLAAWAALAVLGSAALGSAGAAAAGLAHLQQPGVWVRLAGATALSCLLEGVTTQLDNVFMPLHYFALLLCL